MKDYSDSTTGSSTWDEVSANTERKWFEVQNLGAEDLYIFQSYGGAEAPETPFAGAILLPVDSPPYSPSSEMAMGGTISVMSVTDPVEFTFREIA